MESVARKDYRGYRFAKSEPVVELAASALARCGHEVRYGLSGGAADANVFNERGLRCLNLTHGVYDFHSPNERVAVADLEAMVDVTVALVEGARA
jgi:tripeptide aminopeptidase